ncbi:MAG: toll/interleukin-1 receptor domain-containing protein [Lachnospiraceae bacterium]|nr:toll/interleukin-1 receptor domain-containing protein [Lachnospiraceae bacterium]
MDHYNAFISYKHAPEDNRVAEAVHKGLERFHIPGKIRRSTGVKRINRIFRDKDELPITSDLSDTISNALKNSDYLIVICSTNTKESAWVPREIECFLENHSKKEIFTVLVNGEPYDVIPDVLKYDDRTVKDDNGNEQTVRIPVEPLSCDYRMPLNKAKKTELPRLASGIIGCAYDELMNRRRQYRIKQLTAVFSVALALMAAFSAYMFYSRDKIRKTYLESLKNQSRYLAKESQNLLEKEQRITALQLALEALPKDDQDERPVTAEAVRALTEATLAYEGNKGTNIHAAWNYEMPNVISDFEVGGDGKTVAIRDDGNIVGVWDTETHKNIIYLDGEIARIKGMRYLDDEKLAVWSDKTIICYDVTNGDTLWEYTIPKDAYYSFDDENNLCLNGDTFYIATLRNDYLNFDIKTGNLKDKISMPGNEENELLGIDGPSIVESRLSPDGKRIAVRALEGWNSYTYGVFDLDSKDLKMSDPVDEMIKNIEWVSDDTFVTASTDVDLKGSMSIGSKEIMTTDHSTVKCIDADSLAEKWNSDFACNGVTINSGFLKLEDSVVFYSGNVATAYDIKTGAVSYSNNMNDSVIDASDRDKDGTPVYITENGGYAAPAPSVDRDAVYYSKNFTDDLRQVIVNKGVYARQHLAHEIIYYGVNVYDEEWTALCDDAYLPDLSNGYILGDDCLVVLSEDESRPVLNIFTLGAEPKHIKKQLEGEGSYKYKLLGIRNGKVFLGHDVEDGDPELISIDIVKDAESSQKLPDMDTSFRDSFASSDGKFIYTVRTEDYEKYLVAVDMESADKKEIKIPEEISYISGVPAYFEEIKAAAIKGDADFIMNIESGEAAALEVPEDWAGADCYSDKSINGLFAVSDGKQILLADKGGKVKTTIACPGISPIGMTFSGDDLLVLYNDGSLNRYSVESGEFLKNIDVLVYYYYTGDVIFDHDPGTGMLYISMDDLLSVVDMENGIETASIANCFGYNKDRDIFITTSKKTGEDKEVGYFRRYTVKDLIDKAHAILKDTQLSDELKSRYGIED